LDIPLYAGADEDFEDAVLDVAEVVEVVFDGEFLLKEVERVVAYPKGDEHVALALAEGGVDEGIAELDIGPETEELGAGVGTGAVGGDVVEAVVGIVFELFVDVHGHPQANMRQIGEELALELEAGAYPHPGFGVADADFGAVLVLIQGHVAGGDANAESAPKEIVVELLVVEGEHG